MEGSVTLWIPAEWKISKKKHPWRRTYTSRKAKWEVDDHYCELVVQAELYSKKDRLLDIMDAAVFDFLIGNADRHHYEYFSDYGDDGLLLLLDNGKSFGNPNKDERSILAPIYQCCQIRRSTLTKLKSFSTNSDHANSLSQILANKLKKDPLYPVLTDAHLRAIDRRLEKILKEVEVCFEKKGINNVLK